MSGQPMPEDVVRLVTHVELNQTGWWDRALDRLVLALVSTGASTVPRLCEQLSPLTRAELAEERVNASVQRLVSAQQLAVDGIGKLIVTMGAKTQLEDLRRAAEDDDRAVEERFLTDCVRSGLDVDPLVVWKDVNELFVDAVVRTHGARLYEILSSRSEPSGYQDLVAPLETRYGPAIRPVLLRFVDPSDALARRFLLRRLNAEFLRDAATLPASTLKLLSRKGPGGVHRVLLDSNFVFSILGLHDNPGNQLASGFLAMAARCRSEIPTRMFVLPITIDEIKRTLRAIIARLDGVIISPNMAKAANSMRSSGLVSAYLTQRSKSLSRLTADDFFGPIERNIVQLLAAKGVNVINEDLDYLRMDQEVIDGIHDLEESQKNRANGPKPYDANLHDMVLWTYARRRLPPVVESPLDGKIWIATVDFGLIAWDRRKRRGGLAVVVSPSDLTQLFAFFVPRDEEYERALVESLREPLLYMDFDPDDESTTLSILGHLARYESSDHLSVETVRTILLNDSLRSKIASKNVADADQPALIRDAIVATVERAREEAARASAERDQLRSAVAGLSSQVETLSVEINALRGADLQQELSPSAFSGPGIRDVEVLQPEAASSTVKGRLPEHVFVAIVLGLLAFLAAIALDRPLLTLFETRWLRLTLLFVGAVAVVGGSLDLYFLLARHRPVYRSIVRRAWNISAIVILAGIAIGVLGNFTYDDLHHGKSTNSPGKDSNRASATALRS